MVKYRIMVLTVFVWQRMGNFQR